LQPDWFRSRHGYKKKCKPIRFETTPEQFGLVLVRVEFDADGMVEALRRAFDPSVAEAMSYLTYPAATP
jgi:hypothetical protein